MNNTALTKESIKEKVDEKELFDFYLRPFHSNSYLRAGQNISNPFLPEKQKTPSFNIYQNKGSQRWSYHDFATSDHGDIFSLVMRLRNVNFINALRIINSDFNLNLT